MLSFLDELDEEKCELCDNECTCERAKCMICLGEIPTRKLMNLSCNHKFCKECLMGLTKSETKIHKFPPRCPVCRRGFKELDVQSILPNHVFEVWDYLKNFHHVKKENDFFACRTPNCRNGLLYSSSDEPIWKCDKCQHQYCLKCKREGHTGSCDSYEMFLRRNQLSSFTVRQLFQKGKLKRCPTCRIYTHRLNRSIDMQCGRCGSSWCWHCIKLRGKCKCRRRRGHPNAPGISSVCLGHQNKPVDNEDNLITNTNGQHPRSSNSGSTRRLHDQVETGGVPPPPYHPGLPLHFISPPNRGTGLVVPPPPPPPVTATATRILQVGEDENGRTTSRNHRPPRLNIGTSRHQPLVGIRIQSPNSPAPPFISPIGDPNMLTMFPSPEATNSPLPSIYGTTFNNQPIPYSLIHRNHPQSRRQNEDGAGGIRISWKRPSENQKIGYQYGLNVSEEEERDNTSLSRTPTNIMSSSSSFPSQDSLSESSSEEEEELYMNSTRTLIGQNQNQNVGDRTVLGKRKRRMNHNHRCYSGGEEEEVIYDEEEDSRRLKKRKLDHHHQIQSQLQHRVHHNNHAEAVN